jgi:diguanylate cyclase (GGDEF)-like protein
MVISVVDDDRILNWPATKTGSPLQKVLEKFLETGVTKAGYIIRSKEIQQHGWWLYAVVDQNKFFADINRHLLTLLGVIAFVAALLFALTVAALQPIIRALLREQKLVEMSTHDGLTGLYNHAHMQEQLGNELARSKRYGRPLSVLMIDIDRFKAVNDTHGHQAGDDVLRRLAQCLQLAARTQDIVSRYGGEEFMLILPETGSEAAMIMAERLRADVASMRLMTKGHEFTVTISIGVVTYDTDAGEATQRDLVEVADKALYASKDGGRNRVTAGVLATQAHDQTPGVTQDT